MMRMKHLYKQEVKQEMLQMYTNIDQYLQGMDEYIQWLKDFSKTNPEEAKKYCRQSLIDSGVLNSDGSVKDRICNA